MLHKSPITNSNSMKDEFIQAFSGRACIVTGGTGMIGRSVVRMLCDAGAKVRIISLDRLEVDSRADHIFGDLADFEFCKRSMIGADYALHVAGIKGSIDVTKSKPASFFVPLLQMNTNILEAARLAGVRGLVYTSSIGAYASAEVFVERDALDTDPPMDMFPGWAKRMAEMQIQAYKIQYGLENFAVVRPCNVYGPGDNFDPNNAMVIPSLMARVASGERPLVVWGDGSAVRDFAYTDDVAEGTILALIRGTGGRYVNLGSGIGVTIKELVETLQKVTPFEYRFDTTKSGGFPRRIMNISLAQQLLGYEPRTFLEEGLRKTWEWYQANPEEYKLRKNYFAESTKP
jgi:GDP-L-fucose synthase